MYTEKGQRGTRYVVEYTNSCKELIEEYIDDVENEYGVAVKVLKHKMLTSLGFAPKRLPKTQGIRCGWI
ncbi:MAG: hypothetical protein DRO12_02770 [Thermoprotei archaeon]|nr:MAG: hypothetical protein DRO12_02770 [Thermoprotei archaeon]